MNILKEYEVLDERIIVISKENGGLSAARNAGLEVDVGEFIAFVDSDDWVYREYFSVLLKAQRKLNCDVVVCEHFRTKDEKVLDFPVRTVTESICSR